MQAQGLQDQDRPGTFAFFTKAFNAPCDYTSPGLESPSCPDELCQVFNSIRTEFVFLKSVMDAEFARKNWESENAVTAVTDFQRSIAQTGRTTSANGGLSGRFSSRTAAQNRPSSTGAGIARPASRSVR
jgi:hypothetical protein